MLMFDETYNTADTVQAFFKLLNDSAIEYVLIKNIGGELPHKLKKDKDIDILVPKQEVARFKDLVTENGFMRITHPKSKKTGWSFAYGASECYMFKSGAGLEVDIHSELCLKSLMGNIWIPMDKCINDKAWSNKVWDEQNKWWIIDDKTQLVYLISRCVFDKREFSLLYIAEIKKRSHLLDDHSVQIMLKKVFFQFTDRLMEMLTSEQYASIVGKHLAFRDY
jgi:hypothetical protein